MFCSDSTNKINPCSLTFGDVVEALVGVATITAIGAGIIGLLGRHGCLPSSWQGINAIAHLENYSIPLLSAGGVAALVLSAKYIRSGIRHHRIQADQEKNAIFYNYAQKLPENSYLVLEKNRNNAKLIVKTENETTYCYPLINPGIDVDKQIHDAVSEYVGKGVEMTEITQTRWKELSAPSIN